MFQHFIMYYRGIKRCTNDIVIREGVVYYYVLDEYRLAIKDMIYFSVIIKNVFHFSIVAVIVSFCIVLPEIFIK